MKAREIMTRNVVCLGPEDQMREAFDAMRSAGVRHIPVVVGRHLVGILSDRDILPFTCGGTLAEDRLVKEVMTEVVVVGDTRTTIAQLAERMLTHKIDSIPIIDGDKLVGIVTSSDLIALLLAKPDSATVLPFEFNLITTTNEAWPAAAACA